MSYELITRYDSRNFTPAASVPATYGRQRTIDSITIHWWGLPEWNATFFGTVDFLCTNKKPTSAHEVIEAGRVAVIVNHGDASWAAGNATGNATSIHLELNPRASDADYATAAERVRDIRAMHGKDLPLIPHRTWQATMCPGVWDLARLDRMARGSTITTQGTTTQVQEDDMPLTSEDRKAIAAEVWGFANPTLDPRDMRQIVADIEAQGKASPSAIALAVWGFQNPELDTRDMRQVVADSAAGIADLMSRPAADIAAQLDAAGIAADVRDELAKLLGAKSDG